MHRQARINLTSVYKSLSCLVTGRIQSSAPRLAARRENSWSEEPALQRIRTNPAPAFQLLKPQDRGKRPVVCANHAKVIKKLIFLILFEKQSTAGAYTKWTDWSKCTADCEKDPNHAVVTRSKTNLENPNDVQTQEIPCESPCPPGNNNI